MGPATTVTMFVATLGCSAVQCFDSVCLYHLTLSRQTKSSAYHCVNAPERTRTDPHSPCERSSATAPAAAARSRRPHLTGWQVSNTEEVCRAPSCAQEELRGSTLHCARRSQGPPACSPHARLTFIAAVQFLFAAEARHLRRGTPHTPQRPSRPNASHHSHKSVTRH